MGSDSFLYQLLIAVIVSSLGFSLIWVTRRLARYIRNYLNAAPPADRELKKQEEEPLSAAEIEACNDGVPLRQKLRLLREELAEAEKSVRDPLASAAVRNTAETRANELARSLWRMNFLCEGQELDQRFILKKRLGSGRVSQVWLAQDKQVQDSLSGDVVALKFLRYPYSDSAVCTAAFTRAAAVSCRLDLQFLPRIRDTVVRGIHREGDPLVYYAMDYIQGETLESHLVKGFAGCKSTADRQKFAKVMARLVLRLGEGLLCLHDQKYVHRDLEPSNILVDKNGNLRLVDLDFVAAEGGGGPAITNVDTYGFAAPEVLENDQDHGGVADLFSLARILIYIFREASLPNPYAASSRELIDTLECPPGLRPVLALATNIRPDQRQKSLKEFLDQAGGALQQDIDAPPVRRVLRAFGADSQFVYRMLRHVTWGTFIAMSLARPVFAYFDAAHVSENLWIAVFHGFLGSFIWANLITIAFLLYRTGVPDEGRSGYVLSATACGTAGFLGGVICGVLSAGITSVTVLAKIGWISEAIAGCRGLENFMFLDKVNCSVATGLIWAFPLTGGFTGIGLGLWLNYKTNSLIRQGTEGMSGIPRKTRQFGALFNSIRFVFSPVAATLLLMITIVGSAFSILLFWRDGGPQWMQVQRSIGEGAVHFFGSLGLVVGYFLGLAPARGTKKEP